MQTAPSGSRQETSTMNAPASDPFLAVIRELLRIHSKIRRLFRQVEDSTGLSTMELAVLATIAESSFPLTASDIGRRLGYPRQVIQRTANELAARGLSEGRANPAHRRAQLLVLTPAGVELKAVADRRAREISATLLKGLEVARCADLAAELRNVRAAIDGHLAEAGAALGERTKFEKRAVAPPTTPQIRRKKIKPRAVMPTR